MNPEREIKPRRGEMTVSRTDNIPLPTELFELCPLRFYKHSAPKELDRNLNLSNSLTPWG